VEVKHFLRVIIPALLFGCVRTWAQQSNGIFNTLASDTRDAAAVSWRVVRAPFQGRAADYAVGLGVLSGVALTFTLDGPVRESAAGADGPWSDAVVRIGDTYSSPAFVFGTAGGLYLLGLAADEPGIRRAGVETCEALGIALVGTQALKTAVGRERPYGESGPYHFSSPGLDNLHSSFPSGDVTLAFVLSSVLAAESKSLPLAVWLYSLAGMTVYQRLKRDQHWFSDTVAAAVWATAVGWTVVYYHHRNDAAEAGLSIGVKPNAVELKVVF